MRSIHALVPESAPADTPYFSLTGLDTALTGNDLAGRRRFRGQGNRQRVSQFVFCSAVRAALPEAGKALCGQTY